MMRHEGTPRVELSGLQRAWAVPGPWRVRPLGQGTNNLVCDVDTPAGRYVLRVYANHTEPRRLRFEQAVLAHVEAAGLPFAVPAALPTSAGEPYARVATDGGEALATLTRWIPGASPRGDDLAQVLAAGEALGLLDRALVRITPPDPSEALSWRSYGDLAHCHALVPDPPSAIAELPIPEAARQRLARGYAWLIERIPDLYASLPQQLTHEDYAQSNVLMEGDRVSGVLDFEFCARDVRVMDLTVALSWWPLGRFGTGAEWPIVAAFVQGYARYVTIAAAEIAAIPTLFQLRAYTSLIHRLGRWRQGLSALEAVAERADAALEREDWLRTNSTRLVEAVRAGAAG